jgi:hypothetical protein
MGLPFAHGTQKRLIVAALWRLSPFKIGDNPRQVSLAQHAGPFQWLHGCIVFSKIDLIKGYHQIPVTTEDVPNTMPAKSLGWSHTNYMNMTGKSLKNKT